MNELDELRTQLIDLQTRVAYQDDTLLTLNDVVAEQQLALTRLQERVKDLSQQLRKLREAAPSGSAHELPPHY